MNEAKQLKIHHIVSLFVRFILGAIFIVAGIPKIMDTASFATVVYNYHLLPDILINLFSIILPWMEVIIGSLLIFGLWMHGTVVLYTLLMIAFIAALSFNAARGLDISCGCFSTGGEGPIDLGTIFRDIFILIGALYLIFVVFIKQITSDNILIKNDTVSKD